MIQEILLVMESAYLAWWVTHPGFAPLADPLFACGGKRVKARNFHVPAGSLAEDPAVLKQARRREAWVRLSCHPRRRKAPPLYAVERGQGVSKTKTLSLRLWL